MGTDTYMISQTSAGGIFTNMGTLKSEVIQRANAFAESKGKVAILGCVIGSFGNLLVLWQPLSPAFLLLGSFLSGFAIAAFICVLFAIEGDLADEAHARTGIRAQALICAAVALGYKFSLGLGAGSVGWLLGAANYDATATVASAAVQQAITVAFVWIPLVGNVLGGAVLLFYKLDARLPSIKLALASPPG